MPNSGKHDNVSEIADNTKEKMKPTQPKPRHKRKAVAKGLSMILIGFLVGSVSGYLLGIRTHGHDLPPVTSRQALMEQINPPEGYALLARFSDIGPELLAAGAIDLDRFVGHYERSGLPLTAAHIKLLTEGSDDPIVISRENANFLLNLFWAFGLANENPVLTEGLMMNYGMDGVMNFASTGGWTLGAKPVEQIYASMPMISLTDEQQELLQSVAAQIFRPCCNNPTLFPDCNHGMAMLGLLEWMISQGAPEESLFEAAKYINGYWFFPQSLELATYFSITETVDFDTLDSRKVVGSDYAAAEGFRTVHQWLLANQQLTVVPWGVNNCGV
ncbi:MAG: hypothetical protein SCH68_05135 [Brevefilum sp.]|nr:hypothetical protein [Brevefilum sp.]